ncbi:MAG: hypothetical protein LBK41_02960 [Clostridiales bacterium]|nr:hypothetical protein [Clostridiales bacterium]
MTIGLGVVGWSNCVGTDVVSVGSGSLAHPNIMAQMVSAEMILWKLASIVSLLGSVGAETISVIACAAAFSAI